MISAQSIVQTEKGNAVLLNLENVSEESIGHCSACGGITELVELPGRVDKFCLECSADLATAVLLITEIDAATLAERNTNVLQEQAGHQEIASRSGRREALIPRDADDPEAN
jgi:hypothetical protein